MSAMQSFVQVTPSMLKQSILIATLADQPLFVWGKPGIGKSNIFAQFCAENGYILLDLRVSQWDAVDTRGVPYVVESDDQGRTTKWAIPDVFPTDPDAKVLVLFDELNSGPLSVQAALYQLFLPVNGERRLGDYVLPKQCRVMAAGNLETDRAVTTRMSTALAGRMTHLELMVDHDSWERWAIDADIHHGCIAYLRWKKESLHSWDANSASKAQATPRTWEFTSNLVKQCEANSFGGTAVESAMIRGTLGDAVGSEFAGFLPLFRQLPDPDSCINAPDSAPIMKDPSLGYSLAVAIGDRATKQNFAKVIRYAQRLRDSREAGPEFMTLVIKVAVTKTPALKKTAEWTKFCLDNPKAVI